MSGKKKRKMLLAAGIIILVLEMLIQGAGKRPERRKSTGGGITENLAELAFQKALADICLLPSFLEQGQRAGEKGGLTEKAMEEAFPLYAYTFYEMQEEPGAGEKGQNSADSLEQIRLKEGTDENQKTIEEENLDYGEGALHIDSDLMAEMQRENEDYQESQDQAEKPGEDDLKNTEDKGDADTGNRDESWQNEGTEGTGAFEPAAFPAYSYDWSEDWDYEKMVSNFYAIDGTTGLDSSYVGLNQLLYQDMAITRSSEGPDILIYHTHSLEDFADSVPGDPSTTITGAGARLAEILQDTYGFSVMHHTGGYDVEARDDAYNKSLPAIEQILAENPTIQVVIDLHRDEMKEGKKLVMDLEGRPTARFMFFNGMSYLRDKGKIAYLENPYLQDNLAFSFQMQVAANEYYPGLARKIYLKAYRYNLHLCPKSLLIELGAQTNTVEEIMNACDPLAHIISIVLNGQM